MMKPCFYKFFSDVMTWQRATFGDIDSRSPVGACNHLIKEIQTEMLPEALLTGKVPLKEVVDGYVLMSEIAGTRLRTFLQRLRISYITSL
jgi:hypothetical protein